LISAILGEGRFSAGAFTLGMVLLVLCVLPGAGRADTCPNASSRVGASAALPDCRAYELVTPGLNGAAPPAWPEVGLQGMTDDGSALAFLAASAPSEAEGAIGTPTTILARRGLSGWSTRSLSAATPLPSGTFFGPVASTVGISADLTQTVLWSNQPLAGSASPAGANLYLRRGDGIIVPLTKIGALGLDPSAVLSGASHDFSRLFLTTTVKQLDEDPLLNGNIYEYSAGLLRLVTILPEAVEEPAPAGGTLPQGVLPPVSADGRQVLFKAIGFPGLYLRSDGTKSVEVSQSQRTTPDPNPPAEATSAGISADGSTVLFTSANELTDDANTGRSGGVSTDAGQDLYALDVTSGDLTDLSVDTEAADEATGANVEAVLGASRDAAHVYFVATGKLAPGATSGQRNLYVTHAGTTDFIATDPVPGAHFYVTPDGRHAAFASAAPAPGYDNGAQAMVYRYSYGAGTECASCRPGGELPTADASLADRALSDDGSRLFFQSADAILPLAQSTFANVFEYATGEVHLLSPGEGAPAILLGASASGEDVFIASFDALAPQGPAGAFAIYDARVGAIVPTPGGGPSCQGEGCRNTFTTPASDPSPGSADFEAPARIAAPESRTVVAKKVHLRVIVPGQGSLEIGGRGFTKVNRQLSAAGSVPFTLTLRPGPDRKRHRFGIFRTEAEILFRSAGGSLSRAGISLVFLRGRT
jgi:hypothetical protein